MIFKLVLNKPIGNRLISMRYTTRDSNIFIYVEYYRATCFYNDNGYWYNLAVVRSYDNAYGVIADRLLIYIYIYDLRYVLTDDKSLLINKLDRGISNNDI